MSDSTNPLARFIARSTAVALGLLLIPLTLTPNGLDENLACSAEGPGGKCIPFVGVACDLDGELVQDKRLVE